MKAIRRVMIWLLAAAPAAWAQTSGTLTGRVLDPSGAAIVGAKGVLTDQARGSSREFSTVSDGSFVLPNVPPGAYEVAVEAAGFKRLALRDVVLTAGEIRSLGALTLELGGLVESVAVEAQGAPIQLASGERSGLVTASQLSDIAVRGRDFMSYMITIPGVIDENWQGREAMARNANSGLHINGSRSTQVLMTVDGMGSMDPGNNGVPQEPNMDAIAEVKIMTSNYQAEYGRNAGGLVAITTKSGSKEFHGSAYNYYRHESLNANNFFNNRTGTAKPPYRYRITGYSIGGPILIPKTGFNRNRDKAFFFFSQEFVGSKVSATSFVNMPTERERQGDFSQSYDVNGAVIGVRDPTTGRAFPGNLIPESRISPLGQAMLKFLPLPNYTDPEPSLRYRRNYRAVGTSGWPLRQEVLRVDYQIGPSLQVFYRLIQDYNRLELQLGSQGWPAGSVNFLLSPVIWDRPARGQVFHGTHILSPWLVHEFSFTRTFNNVIIYPTKAELLDRGRMGSPPEWFRDQKPAFIPALTFGSVPVNPANTTLETRLPSDIPDPGYTFTENVTLIRAGHTFKAGVYAEFNNKRQSATTQVRGAFNFGRDTNNALDTGHGYANPMVGVFTSYSEATNQPRGDYKFWDVEWYLQDNWRVAKRLTLDFGLRMYHMPATADHGGALATFVPGLWQASQAPALYVPAFDANRRRVAQDPISGAQAPAALIGFFVPGSGDYANGSRKAGDGIPLSLYTAPAIGWGPRLGFAWDVFGNGQTAVRGGFGVFLDKVTGNTIYNSAANPPVTFTPTLFYGTLDTYARASGVIAPSNLTTLWGEHPLPSVMNFNLGVQQRLRTATLDVAYVGSLGRHLSMQRNINPIPMFARFEAKNLDATTNRPLPDNFLRPYRGYGNINERGFGATSNYHSLQASVNRRFVRGLQMGASYTWSKVLTVSSGDTGGVSAYFPMRSWNYGPADFDQTHVFVFNYIYDLPKPGARTGFRPARWVLDNWQVSGITAFMSGQPFTPGFTTVDGQDITGSTDGARITVTGDPRLEKSGKSFYRTFKTEAFRRTPQGSFGNAGVGLVRGPGVNNWDLSLTKRFPLFKEGRHVQFRAETFNAFNHTQFSGVYSTARFDAAGNQVDPNFGAYSSARRPRNIQLSLRLMF